MKYQEESMKIYEQHMEFQCHTLLGAKEAGHDPVLLTEFGSFVCKKCEKYYKTSIGLPEQRGPKWILPLKAEGSMLKDSKGFHPCEDGLK